MMWGPGPWAWGFWWICPLVGLILGAVAMIVMVRAMRGGHGPMCMGGHGQAGAGRHDETQREIRELREEIRQLRTPR